MTTIKTTVPATTLITERDILIAEIKQAWSLINKHNVIDKDAEKHFSIEGLYNQIKKDEDKLVRIKMATIAANFGITDIELIPKENLYWTIFPLQNISERIVKLGLIPTKKDDGQVVEFTRNFINDEISKLSKEVTKLRNTISGFNGSHSIKI